MNYSLNIQLEGADDVEKTLDSIISKMGNLENIKMDKLIDASGILGNTDKFAKMGKMAADKFNVEFKKNSQGMWQGVDQLPDFMKKKGFFPKEKKENPTDTKGILVGALATLFNPFVGARMLSNSIGAMQGNKSGGANGIFGLAGAMGYGEIFVTIKLLQAAFKALMSVVRSTAQAYENARQLYAKSLMSGLGLQFTSQRQLLAGVMGVSETEVVKFGAAVGYLSPKLAHASKIMAETTPRLTAVSWEFGVLKADMSALFAKLASDVAPAMKMFIGYIDQLVISLEKLLSSPIIKNALVGFMNGALPAWASILLRPAVQAGSAANAANKTGNLGVPDPLSYMKQLPVSTWEKLGLVMGNGGNTTNDLIKKGNEYLKVIASAVKNTGGVPRAFGFDPATANP